MFPQITGWVICVAAVGMGLPVAIWLHKRPGPGHLYIIVFGILVGVTVGLNMRFWGIL